MHLCVKHYVIAGHTHIRSMYDKWMKESMKEWTKTNSIHIHIKCLLSSRGVAQRLNCLPPIWETWVQSMGWEDPLEKEMATHSSTLAWRIPWTEEPGRLQSVGSKKSDTTEWLHIHFQRENHAGEEYNREYVSVLVQFKKFHLFKVCQAERNLNSGNL